MADIYIHPTALVESKNVGEGTRIWAFTHVMQGASIGANCNVGEHCFIESGAVVGSNVTIKNGNELWEGVTLADGVFVGPNVSFTNDLRPRSPRLPQAARRYNTHGWLSLILVEKGASIGAGAIILAGNTIGAFAMVGAGAVVTHSLPAHALVVGAPARIAGWVCECGCRLTFHDSTSVCEDCGLTYTKDANSVRLTPQPVVKVLYRRSHG
jgi:acetyltransferase-like isoleucine patch superfamily enzyme